MVFCFMQRLLEEYVEQCLHTVHEQAAEPIAGNIYSHIQSRLCVETHACVSLANRVFFWIRNAFDTGDECIYVWR